MNDSTPLAYELERLHPAERSIIPDDPALAFLSDLIEDFADEWVTKMMFHYRWFYADDRKFAQLWISGDRMIGAPPEKRQALMTAFNDRQVGRMAMVGCTEANKPIIEESYFRLLDILEPACGADAVPVRLAAVARRFRPVRPAHHPCDRPDAGSGDAPPRTGRVPLAVAARRRLRGRRHMDRCRRHRCRRR